MDVKSFLNPEDVNGITYERLCEIVSKIINTSVEESLRAIPGVATHLINSAGYLKKLRPFSFCRSLPMASNFSSV